MKRSLIPDEKVSIGRSTVGNYRYVSKAEPNPPKKPKKSTSYSSTQNMNSKKSIAPINTKINKKSRLASFASKETLETLPPISKDTTPLKTISFAESRSNNVKKK